jgi:hypothetical protein
VLIAGYEVPEGEVLAVVTVSEDGFEAENPELIIILKNPVEEVEVPAEEPTQVSEEMPAAEEEVAQEAPALIAADNIIPVEDYSLLIFGGEQVHIAAEMLAVEMTLAIMEME